MDIPVDSILTGRAAAFGGKGEPSAIAKLPVSGAVAVGRLGLEGDEQADMVHHGGPDKAIHQYPRDHYPYWQGVIGAHRLLEQAGGFGENISTLGVTEDEVCIGDRFRLGGALVEISQGRQPCWKLGHRLGDPGIPGLVVSSRKSGWYYRVLEPGLLRAGDRLILVERRWPAWTVSLVFGLLVGGGFKADPALTKALLKLTPLSESWMLRAHSLAES